MVYNSCVENSTNYYFPGIFRTFLSKTNKRNSVPLFSFLHPKRKGRRNEDISRLLGGKLNSLLTLDAIQLFTSKLVANYPDHGCFPG
jgi:hypothetical protein